MLTIDEQEARAYQQGDTTLAGALARVLDLQRALGETLARSLEQADEIAHLKRILADALADDSWRERAQAALED